MKNLLVAFVAAGIGAGTMTVVRAANPQVTPGVSVQKMDDDQYPHMHKALEDLRQARHSLEDAEPRFHDHRDKAIDQVDQAIKQCQEALAEG